MLRIQDLARELKLLLGDILLVSVIYTRAIMDSTSVA